jgi:hypothetical protein
MKNKVFSIGLIAAAMAGINACSDDDFSALYPDPAKTTQVSCEKLMTGVFYYAYSWTKPTRDGVEYHDLSIYGKYAQTGGYANSGWAFRVSQAPEMRWNDFYKMLAQYRMLEETYSKLDDAGKRDNEVFTIVAETFVYEQLQQMVDLWGAVPFDGAGTLPITGDAAASKPRYMTGEELYTRMLDRLDTINTRLEQMQADGLPLIASTYLPRQDYICGGNLAVWRKFANALRLRIAMRAALYGSLTTKAQQVLKDMLETNASNYPVIESNADNIYIAADNDAFNPWKDDGNGSGADGMLAAYQADGGINLIASDALLTAVLNDPRRDVMFSPNKNGEWKGMKHDENSATQERNRTEGLYSRIDSATFGWNRKYPGVFFTAAEISFIKAEAQKRTWISGEPKDAFTQGVRQSIEFYYWLNGLSDFHTPLEIPTDAEITNFINTTWDNENDKNKVIATQKWIHFSLFEQREAWAEVRRTGLPLLTFQNVPDAKEFRLPPSRFLYPEAEFLYNKENVPDGAAGRQVSFEKYNEKLFWAKPEGYYSETPLVTN